MIICLLGYCYFTNKHYEWFFKNVLQEDHSVTFEISNSPEPIAHAGGAVQGYTYTNSKEALEQAIKDGYKFIELDLRKTLGGTYFAAHKIKDFNQMTGHSKQWIIPPTVKQVKERKIYDSLTPLLLTDVAEIFKNHPDVVLVTDKASNFSDLLKDFPYPDRLLVEVRSVANVIAAYKAGIKNVALNTSNFEEALENNIKFVVTSPQNASTKEALNFINQGSYVMSASYSSMFDVEDCVRQKGFFVYVDNKD